MNIITNQKYRNTNITFKALYLHKLDVNQLLVRQYIVYTQIITHVVQKVR